MLHHAVEAIQEVGASRARLLPFRPVHEAVDRQGVLARREQLRQLHRPVGAFEQVVLGERAAGRQGPALGGDPLGLSAQLHFLGEQGVTRGAVFGVLARKAQVVQVGKWRVHGALLLGC